MAYVHQSWPSWRFHSDHPPRLIQGPDDEAKLGKGWRDTPQATAVPSDAEDNAAALRRSISPAAVEVSLIPADKEALEKAKEVYGASAEELITRIGQVEDGATLDEVEAIEAKNPKLKGGRKTVLAAIAARRQALAVPQ